MGNEYESMRAEIRRLHAVCRQMRQEHEDELKAREDKLKFRQERIIHLLAVLAEIKKAASSEHHSYRVEIREMAALAIMEAQE